MSLNPAYIRMGLQLLITLLQAINATKGEAQEIVKTSLDAAEARLAEVGELGSLHEVNRNRDGA